MKKLKTEIIVLCLLTLFTLAYSCKKVLNQPVTGVLTGAVLANKAGVDGLLIGAYHIVQGAYSGEPNTSWGSAISNWQYGGIGADDAYKGSTTSDQAPYLPQIEQHAGISYFNQYLEAKWQCNYNGVQRANSVIQEVALVTDGSESTATPTSTGSEAIAEARFLRGLFNMELAKVFRNVPYVDQTVTYSAGNFDVPNPGPIWTQIEADFSAAMASLPITQPEVGRANKYAAEAFLGKAYLYDHKYPQALAAFTDCITNGKTSSGASYALEPFENNFKAVDRNGPEAVFQAQFTVNDGSLGANDDNGDDLNFPGGGTYTSCCGFDIPSYNLANAYKVNANGLPMLGTTTESVTDITSASGATTTVTAAIPNYSLTNLPNDHGVASSAAFTPTSDPVDPRLDWTMGRRGIPYLDWGLCGGEPWTRGDLAPYTPKKNVFYEADVASTTDNAGNWATNQGSADNYNVMRFADVILMRAECYVMTNQLDLAQADVNTIRARAALPSNWVYNYTDNSNPQGGYSTTPAANYVCAQYGVAAGTSFSGNGQSWALQAVMMERQLEFGMEGQRFFDLQRQDAATGSGGPTFAPFGAGYMASTLNAYYAADNRIYNPVLSLAKFTQSRDELWVIPELEIQNEGGKLKQNPGY